MHPHIQRPGSHHPSNQNNKNEQVFVMEKRESEIKLENIQRER